MDGTNAVLRLLFVEDQPDDVELERRQLERQGLVFEWRAVASEPDLRRALAEYRPDVVLCDYSIPGFSGQEALQIVRRTTPYTPFIFVSGTIGEETAVACLREGATDYLLKGNLRRLGPAIRRALSEFDERRRLREIEEARLRLAEILEATPDVVATWNPGGCLTFLNEAGCRLLDVTREEALRSPPDFFYTPQAREQVRLLAIAQALNGGTWTGESAFLTRDGTEIPMSQVILAHADTQGGTRFFSTIARDIRERKAYESRISHLANYDALTALPNRTLFGDRVDQALIHTRRAGRRLAVLAVNLDGFRLINEGFGHAAGDRVLIEMASRIRSGVRDGDTVARFGSDEFVVLLADLARLEDVEPIVRKILAALARQQPLGDGQVMITASAGAAVFPDDGEDVGTLLRNADAAMHRAKSAERGGFQYGSSDLGRKARERVMIQTGLSAALRAGELTMHFQVQRDLRENRACGVEALMRWLRTDGPPVSPATFIRVAEETGLIKSLGEWSLVEACRAACAWTRPGDGAIVLGVNVSALQLHDPGFADVVNGALRSTGFPANFLELEVTEGMLMASPTDALATLSRLKAIGVKIAIDDFGTGYSSLSYLSRLPIDRLKIDQSFVQRMGDDPRGAAIVKSVISLGHGLGMLVIAEGVETERQLAMLKAMECDQAQGFVYSPAVPGERVPALLGAIAV